jgi:hypothetical protein
MEILNVSQLPCFKIFLHRFVESKVIRMEWQRQREYPIFPIKIVQMIVAKYGSNCSLTKWNWVSTILLGEFY